MRRKWENKHKRLSHLKGAFERLDLVMKDLGKEDLREGMVILMKFTNELFVKEVEIDAKQAYKLKQKLFYQWFDAYFKRIEVLYQHYIKNLKGKTLYALRL